jgi:membrane peptidoglycan carboxypeptidase
MLCLVGILSLGATAAIVGLIWGIVWFGQFAGALPPADQLTSRTVFQTTRVVADDGSTLLYEITDPQGGRRTVVPLSQVPRTLIEATIATEDAGFFSNPGFELRSMIRAAFDNLTNRQIVSGASTITQQVVRGVLLTPEERVDQSARRKIKEAIIAYQVTQTYSKEEILQLYLNEIYYGNRSYGVEAAAQGYFGKSVANLDLAESALLAGLPQQPSYYDPYERLDAVKERQAYVLQRMVDQGYITADEGQAAEDEPLAFVDRRHAATAPHFVTYVSDQLEAQLGDDQLYHGGETAVTTLDPRLQSAAEAAVTTNLPALKAAGGNNVALVALDPQSGHILAMVGSANYDDSNIAGEVNMALAPRPSAGILSPLTYALALQGGQTLISRISDPQATRVAVAQGDSTAPAPPPEVALRDAFGRDLPGPSGLMMRRYGDQNFIDLASRIGLAQFDQRVDYNGGQTIAGARVSPIEVAQVYATFAAAGTAHAPLAIEKVVDSRGQPVAQPAPPPVSALDPGIAYLITTVLSDPTFLPPTLAPTAGVSPEYAARDGLSDDRHDAWAAGYTPNLVAVVWTGNANGQPLTGPETADRIWGDFVQRALATRPAGPFEAPADVVELSLCKNPGCSVKQNQPVLRGTESAVQAENASLVSTPVAASGDSRTPLVNRDASVASQATPAPGLAAQPSARPIGGEITIPDVSGTTPDEARQRLSAAGLANAPLIQYASGTNLPAGTRDVAVGQVAGTAPAAGGQAAPGTSIVLIVRRN